MSDGIVKIHGVDYKTVALRLKEFRADHGLEYGISTEVVHHDDERVIVRAIITNSQGMTVASGTGEEKREGNINRTSAMENAETSAVGRALAFFGYAGSEIASADEVAQVAQATVDYELLTYNDCVRENLESISVVKQGIPAAGGIVIPGLLSNAKEAWQELGEDVQRKLWRATTKGGIFTTHERAFMKSTEWSEA